MLQEGKFAPLMRVLMAQQPYKKSEDMIVLLLDTAERLFAQKGYYGVSVRDITGEAGVRNASINYHFGSKEALFVEVIERRIVPLAKARRELLATVQSGAANPAGKARLWVKAFAQPMFDLAGSGDEGWRHYCTLIAHISVQNHMSANMLGGKYDSLAKEFLAALRTIFLDADEYRIQCAFQFMLGTTLYAVCDNKRINDLSDGRFHSDDLDNAADPFLDFVSAGVQSMLSSPD